MKLTDRFQVTVSKKPKTTNTDVPVDAEKSSVDYVAIARETTETAAKYIAAGVAGYMLLDTFRQCAIKFTPQH